MTTQRVFKNISQSDLDYLGWDGTEKQLHFLLNALGCDVTQPIEKVECQHRNLRNQVVDGTYYICSERLDKEYIRSGNASIEALYASTGDNSMVRELKQMGKQMDYETSFKNPNNTPKHGYVSAKEAE